MLFENCIKKLSFEKVKTFDVFKMDRPVRSRLHFNFIKHFHQEPFFFQNVEFGVVNDVNADFSKTPLKLCPFKCTHLGKKSFQYHRLVRKMGLKSVRL